MTSLTKRALLIGTEHYTHLRSLACTRADTAQLAQVLRHPAIGAYDVEVLQDADVSTVQERIAGFLGQAADAEQVLLYVTGHGITTTEFYFASRDTELARLETTAVSASFVNEQLQECAAAQKIAMFDCCQSGGFVGGFTTRVPKSASAGPLLRSRGVYVLSSSGQSESSWGGGVGPDGQPLPSVFTHEVVEALRSGTGDRDGDGLVAVDELFDHVAERIRARDRTQTPEKSSLGVSDRIVLAKAYNGPAFKPDVVPPPPARTPVPAAVVDRSDQWSSLFGYYRACLLADAAEPRLMTQADEGKRFVYVQGTERVLSGDLERDGTCVLPPNADQLAQGDDTDLWYGYPVVVLMDSASRSVEIAPLFVRPVEVDDGGRLRPCGTVQPYMPLARRLLGDEDAEGLEDTYTPSWHPGAHSQMVKDIKHHLREEFQLRAVQELHPLQLEERIDPRVLDSGACNTAMLFTVDRDIRATDGLLKDLDLLEKKRHLLGQTALPSLLEGQGTPDQRPWMPVTPLAANEGQHQIIASAMTRSLTVATGPPGTGKSQLVANLMATAVAAGQKVLVASTNNQAVDEVWRRCSEVVQGSVVRTGSRSGKIDYRREESEALSGLASVAPPAANSATCRAALMLALESLESVRAELGRKAQAESTLLTVGQQRKVAAGAWPGALPSTGSLELWALRSRKLAAARWFGSWRRARFLAKVGWSGDATPDTCERAANLAIAEHMWRAARQAVARVRQDAELSASLAKAELRVRDASRDLLTVAVAEDARRGSGAILELLRSAGNTPDWDLVRSVLPHVKGWAVSTLSARRFPMTPGLFDLVVIDEASQCLVPYVLPLLFRAKRVLIIGDPFQLPPVVKIQPEVEASARRASGVRAAWLEDRRATFHRHSAFQAFDRAAGGSLLLDEHFRCHPEIAAISNRRFYRDQLTLLTDVCRQKRMGEWALRWVDVQGKAERLGSGSWANQAEAEKAHACIEHLLQKMPSEATVGVVTPYKGQAQAISRWFAHEKRVRVGTVHTFQGGECDAIVFTLVAGEGMPRRSIGWVERQLFLWNVAITRARAHLLVVGDRSLWSARGGIGAALVAATESDSGEASSEIDPLLVGFKRRYPSAELHVRSHGYLADARVDGTAILLDRGAGDTDPARHLRLGLRRTELLGAPAVRVPAWTLYDSDSEE